MIYIASDHAGIELKSALKQHIEAVGHSVIDEGTVSSASVDYPDYAQKVATRLLVDPSAQGILICGTGIGMSIAANRFSHVRAALCQTIEESCLARAHNDANVLCLGARVISDDAAIACVDAFLATEFEGGRHTGRTQKLAKSDALDALVTLEKDTVAFGFDWPNQDMIFDQIISECAEIRDAVQSGESSQRIQEEISDLLHAVISLCMYAGFDVNETIAIINKKFSDRMAALKDIAATQGLNSLHGKSFEFMLELWSDAKKYIK
ncbi:MAG: ribose 5-phosphate isomerase B [Pseudomonadota bacterium]